MNKYLDAMAKPFMPITPWLLRLGLGIAFIYHGIGKFPLPPERMVTWFESMGFMYPEIVTSLVALGEVGAGAGIILGGLLPHIPVKILLYLWLRKICLMMVFQLVIGM